ncbi:MAG: hypothetical protein WBC29_03360 [Candidatus Moraniibacteriota bacterium]
MLTLSLPKNFSLSKLLGVAGLWWRQWSSWVFLLLFLVVAGLGVFSWYQSLYAFHWSADEEQSYRLSKNKQVKFQQERFNSALGMLDARVAEHEKTPETFRDVFFGP